MKLKYTEKILQDVLERDHAVLISHDDKLSKRSMIQFICQCEKKEQKIANELVRRTGAFCRECCVKKGVEKTKNTLKLKYDKIPICTLESLYDTVKRDNAILLYEYKEITKNCVIHFRCHCGEESEKNCLQLISVSGAFCKNCTRITWTNKTYNTNMERYGVTCSVHAPAIQQKSKETVMKHYGVEHVFQSEEVRQQINKTILEKYGVEHIMQHEGVKQKQKKNNMERYGVEYSTQREEVKEKMKQTCMKKYGVEHSLQAPEIMEKAQQTCFERYGTRHSQQVPEFKEKTRQTFIKHYGVSNPNKIKEVRDKIKQTCLERYGVEHPSQSQEIAEKTQKNSKKYKEYQMPSGTIRKVQGYEPFALNILLTQYSEEDIKTDRKDVPRILYTVNGISKYYFPDIYITSQNKIIEVKSTWTYQCKVDNIQEKANATQQAGYDYEIWIYDRQGNKIEIMEIEKESCPMNSYDMDMQDMQDMQDIQDQEETIEEKLEHLDDFDNETRMELLYQEIDHMVMHGIQPNEDWYENRINHIQDYQTIDWKDMAVRSYEKDEVIYEAAVTIIDHLDQLEEEWSTSPIFNLCVYQRLLTHIRIIWYHYRQEYGVQGSTVDILDVMNGFDKM